MVGKVTELNDMLSPRGVAGSIVDQMETYKSQRTNKIAELKELRNYIFATDTNTTSNSTLPWKNKTTIPKLTQIRDNLHANYMSALFPNDNWFKWEGGDAKSAHKEKAASIEGYMKNKLKMGGFQQLIARLLYDYIDNGNAFADCEFVNESYKTGPDDEVVQGFVGPKAVRVSMHDLTFNAAAADFRSTSKFVRYVKSLGELKQEAMDNPEMNYNTDVIALMEKNRNSFSTFERSDWDKAAGYIADGFGSLQEYYGSGLVEIIEATGDFHNYKTGEYLHNVVITVVDRVHVIRSVQNPRWLKGSSIVHAGWRLRPDNLYAQGPLDNLVGMQYRIDHLENLKADIFDMVAHPPLVLRGDVDDFEWGPGCEIDVGEDGDVTILKVDTAALNADIQIADLMQKMEEMAGAPKEAMGIRSPGEKTMFEVAQLQNAAGRMFQQKITYFEQEIVEPLLNNMLEKARRNMEVKDLVRVMDDDIGVVEFLEITKEDITATGKLQPIGARHFAAQAQLIQNLNGIFSSPLGAMVAPHTSNKAIAFMLEDVMNLEKFAIFSEFIGITEQAEQQKLINSAQGSIDVDDETPLEEELPPEL